MSKKLLNESTVRRFMGLANLAPLSESFLDSQVNEEEEITENEEVVEETETVDEGGAAARLGNEGHDEGKDRMTADRIHEDALDDEELAVDDELADDELGTDVEMDDAAVDMGDAMDDMGDMDAAAEGGDLASRAEKIFSDLAALINQSAGEEVVTVASTSGDAEADLEADAAMDMDDAGMDMGDATEDIEDELDDLEEDKAYTAKKEKPGEDDREGADKRGAEGTLAKTTGHGKVDYVKESKRKKASVDTLVAEITSKVISRLNK